MCTCQNNTYPDELEGSVEVLDGQGGGDLWSPSVYGTVEGYDDADGNGNGNGRKRKRKNSRPRRPDERRRAVARSATSVASVAVPVLGATVATVLVLKLMG